MRTATEIGAPVVEVEPSGASEPQRGLGTVAPPDCIPFNELTAALTELTVQIGRSVLMHERFGTRTRYP